jgi:hypothetical protein
MVAVERLGRPTNISGVTTLTPCLNHTKLKTQLLSLFAAS